MALVFCMHGCEFMLAFHHNFPTIMHGFILNKLLSHKKDVKLWVWSAIESTILTRGSKNLWINDLLKVWQ